VNRKKVISQLKENGLVILRSLGSHYRLGKGNKRTTVPVHGKRDLSKGLIAAIEKQTGVKLK